MCRLILAVLVELQVPFQGLSADQIYSGVVHERARPPLDAFSAAKQRSPQERPALEVYMELLQSCWSAWPSSRPGFSEVRASAWVGNLQEEQVLYIVGVWGKVLRTMSASSRECTHTAFSTVRTSTGSQGSLQPGWMWIERTLVSSCMRVGTGGGELGSDKGPALAEGRWTA